MLGLRKLSNEVPKRTEPNALTFALHEEQISVDGQSVKIQEFFDEGPFTGCTYQGEALEELQRRLILEREIGLESAARRTQGELAYLQRCVKGVEENDPYFGSALSGHQLKILVEKFPVLYNWGFHSRNGDLREDHLARSSRSGILNWTMHCRDGAGNVPYRAAYWGTFNFGTTPVSVLQHIQQLQNDCMVRSIAIMAPEASITDPVLIANFYKLGQRLLARWGEALEPIKGIDS